MRYIIRGVSQRQECVDYLKTHLPNAEYLIDTPGNAMSGFLHALSISGTDPSIHMEEDIWLTNDFENKIESVISKHKSEVIQFFSMRKADIDIGSRYEPGRTFLMNQCFYLPKEYSKLIYNYYFNGWDDERKIRYKTGYDILIADFLKSRKEKYYISIPSLVDHRRLKSIINPKRNIGRQAKVFLDGIYE